MKISKKGSSLSNTSVSTLVMLKQIGAVVANSAYLEAPDKGEARAGAIKEIHDGFDKAAAGLKKVDEYMVANGWRPLKPGEVQLAQMQLQAIHGGEVAKAKVAEAAAVATVEAKAALPQ